MMLTLSGLTLPDGRTDIVGKRIPVRVKGIDAPELRGKCDAEIEAARQAKQEAVSLIRAAKQIKLRNIERGKYFRLLVDVHLDSTSLGYELVRKGLARRYDGGRKTLWCLEWWKLGWRGGAELRPSV